MDYWLRCVMLTAFLLFGCGLECTAGHDTLAEKLQQLEKQLERALKKSATPAEREQICQKYRLQVNKQVMENSQYGDVKFISTDSSGAVYKVVRPGRNAKIKDGEYIYVYAGETPRYRSYPKTVYPTGQKIKYGKYGNIIVYGENVETAAQLALDSVARSLGDDTLFLKDVPAASSAAEPTVEPAAEQPQVIVNNIYVENSDPIWWHGTPVRVKHPRYRPARRGVKKTSVRPKRPHTLRRPARVDRPGTLPGRSVNSGRTNRFNGTLR